MNSLKVSFDGCRFLALPFVFKVVNDGLGRSMVMSASEFTAIFVHWLLPNRSRDVQWSAARTLSPYTVAVVAKLRVLAPYAAMLVLPGGSLIALLLWLYRRQRKAPFLRGWSVHPD
jgi:hypothetical protein